MVDCEDCAKLGTPSAASQPHTRLLPRATMNASTPRLYDCAACGAKWQQHAPNGPKEEPPYWRRFYEDD